MGLLYRNQKNMLLVECKLNLLSLTSSVFFCYAVQVVCFSVKRSKLGERRGKDLRFCLDILFLICDIYVC